MNSAQLIYRGKLRLSFDIPFLDTPFYLYASHLYNPTLFYISSCGSACCFACGSARVSTVSARVSTYVFARVSACVSLRLLMRRLHVLGGQVERCRGIDADTKM
jgi:Fe-S-cluster containining protein